MSSGTIIHPGVIENIQNNKIFVRILSQSACSTCHAKGACNVAEMKDKIIELEGLKDRQLKKGDEVMVRLDESLGKKAVFLGYVLPLLILVISIIVFISLLENEGLSALISILMLVPYYLVLYLFKKRLRSVFRFHLE
jgi:sigma-E factor negative regulatory protein RseC